MRQCNGNVRRIVCVSRTFFVNEQAVDGYAIGKG